MKHNHHIFKTSALMAMILACLFLMDACKSPKGQNNGLYAFLRNLFTSDIPHITEWSNDKNGKTWAIHFDCQLRPGGKVMYRKKPQSNEDADGDEGWEEVANLATNHYDDGAGNDHSYVDMQKVNITKLDGESVYQVAVFRPKRIVYCPNPNGLNYFIKKVTQWGNSKWTTMRQMFARCVLLNGMPSSNDSQPDLSQCTDMSKMFFCALTFNQDISKWDVSNVKNMEGMFAGTSFNQDIGKWNVSNVSDMSEMFMKASAFNQDIGNWDVSNVKNMGAMFDQASAFNQDIGNWDVSNVKNMSLMFTGAEDFNQDIGNWNVRNVSDMSFMFASTIFNQDIGKWDVSNVKNMEGMFYKASAFNQDIGKWNVSNVKNMEGMFVGATSFNLKDIINWDLSGILPNR